MLVIFDCDGVLVDSEDVANQVLVKHIQQLGVPISESEGREQYRGLSLNSIIDQIKTQYRVSLPSLFLENLQRETYQKFAEHLQPIAGVEAAIRWLNEQKIKYCVASSGNYEKLNLTLSTTKLKQYFEGRIFSASEVEFGKPSPDLFLFAAKKMGFHPNSCLVVEDSIPGVMAGLSAGMHVFAYCGENDNQYIDKVKALGVTPFTSMSVLPSLVASSPLIK